MEEFKKKRVDEFQREEAERIRDKGDFLLTNYEEKVRVCEEKMKQNLKKKAKSVERNVRNNSSNEKKRMKIEEEEPRKVRILRRIGNSARSLENKKRLEETKEKEKEKIEEIVERSEGKERKIYQNVKKNKEEMMIKFEMMKIKREENWTNYQRNKRAKKYEADVYLEKLKKKENKIRVLKDFKEFLIQCKYEIERKNKEKTV